MSKTKSKEQTLLSDELIESGADLSSFLQNPRAVPAAIKPQKVNVDFPSWVVNALDFEADRMGIPRQSLIKVWIVERLESEAAKR